MISAAPPALPIPTNSHLAPPAPASAPAPSSSSPAGAEAGAAPSAAPASRQSLYEGSSQYRHWRFSPEQLAQTRASLNAAAVKAIKDAFEADSPGSSSAIAFLDQHEEYTLVKLYVGKVAQLCGHFHFSEEVEATAVSYLKRFYLKNTVMDWHPKNVMLTALFLAAKTTNNPISLDDYTSHIPKTAPADVLDLEFLIAQSLGFEFAVWHAHRALWGLKLDMETLPDASGADLDALYDAALEHVRASRLTDAELIYTPSQIALAAFAVEAPALAERWAEAKGQSALVGGVLLRIQELVRREGVGPEVEVVREVDRRLRICKNPEKVKGSKAWMKREREKEEAAREKRVRKAEEARKAMEAEDPFGGQLDESVKVEAQDDLDDDDD